MTPMLIHCVGLTALASSASAFAAPAAAAPLTFPVSVAPSTDSVDGLTSVALPNAPAGLFGTATLTQTLLESAQTSRSTSGGTVSLPPEFSRDHVGPPHSSVLRVMAPRPAAQSGSGGGGNLLTFVVGGEPVAPLTDDQTSDVILGTSRISTALPFYVYVPNVQQQDEVRDTTISTDALGARVIGGLAGLGLLAMVVLVAVWNGTRALYLDQRARMAKEESTKSIGVPMPNTLGLIMRAHPLTTSPCWVFAIHSPGRMCGVPSEPSH